MSETRADDLSEWYGAQYRASVDLAAAEGGVRFKQFVSDFPAPYLGQYPITGRSRMNSFLQLKLRYPFEPDGYSCLAMSATIEGARAHYAYAYWSRGQEVGVPDYVCISPTYESRDGEYRRRFISGPAFFAACAASAGRLAPFEAAVLEMTLGAGLELAAEAYPGAAAGATARLAGDLRLPTLAFAVALMLDLWEHEQGLLMAHTSEAYIAVLVAVARLTPAALALVPPDAALFGSGSPSHKELQAKCGQKLVPMLAREAMQVLDYNLAAWRELAIARLVGDITLNFISPSFALYNQWTFIEGGDVGIFENAAMGERYARGAAVEAAAAPLRAARRGVGLARPNYHTEELDAHLYESLEYAQSYLIMSPTVLLHTMEDVGWTLHSHPTFVRRAVKQWPAAVDAFAAPGPAARHLFELAYAAHCLHTRAGVAHTDLHCNNMTFYLWGPDRKLDAPPPYYDDPVVAYVAGPRGEADTYVFPAAGSSACIIDYSRCILGPAFRGRLEEGRSPQYATNFYRDQVNRVMRALHRYAPEYVAAHQNAIKSAVLANLEAVFPALCAADFIAIGANLGALLEAEARAVDPAEARPFRVHPRAVALARQLEEVGRELLITGLHGLVNAAGARAPPPAFPGAAALERVFGEWLFPRWAAREPGRVRTAQLVDAYNHGNAMRWRGDDYAAYPPWARLDEIERHLGAYRLTDLFGPDFDVERFLAALRPGARIEVLAAQARAAQEKLDGKPISTASSWLDE
jgi:hypothetical protein